MDDEPHSGDYVGPSGETVRVSWLGAGWTCVIVAANRRSAAAQRLTLEYWRELRPAPDSPA